MADNSDDAGSAGREKVAYKMAVDILLRIEGRDWNKLTREEYLNTVFQCIRTLKGLPLRG